MQTTLKTIAILKSFHQRNAALVLLLAMAFGTSNALADMIGTWSSTSGGTLNYETTTNWSGGIVADGAGATGTFQTAPGSNLTIRFTGFSHTLGTMNVGNTNGRSQSFSANSTSERLIFDNGINPAQLTELATHGNNTYFYLPILLNSSLNISNLNANNRTLNFGTSGGNFATITNSTSSALTITNNASSGNSAVSLGQIVSDGTSGGTMSVVQSSTTGALMLGAANTYTGTTKANVGTLQLSHLSAIQYSALDTTGSGTVTANAGVGNYVFGGLISGRDLASVVTGTPTNVTTLTLNPQSGSVTYNNAIGDLSTGMNLTKTGNGTQVLSGTSTYTGDTLVSAGTLLVNGSLSSSTNDVSVTGTATIGGSGSIAGALSFAPDSFFDVFLSQPLAVSGTVTFGSGFGIDNLKGIDWDAVALGDHTILASGQDFSSAGLDNWGIANAVTVGSLGRTAYFDNGSLKVVVTAVPEPGTALLCGLGLLTLLAVRRRRRN